MKIQNNPRASVHWWCGSLEHSSWSRVRMSEHQIFRSVSWTSDCVHLIHKYKSKYTWKYNHKYQALPLQIGDSKNLRQQLHLVYTLYVIMYCIYKWFTAISLSIFNFHFWSIFRQRPDSREVDKDDYWNDRSSDQTPWAGRPVLWNEHDDKRSGRQNQLDVSLVLGSRRAFIWNKEKYRKSSHWIWSIIHIMCFSKRSEELFQHGLYCHWSQGRQILL